MTIPGLIAAPGLVASLGSTPPTITYRGQVRVYDNVTSANASITISDEGNSCIVIVGCCSNAGQQRQVSSVSVGGVGGSLSANLFNNGGEYSSDKRIYVCNNVPSGTVTFNMAVNGNLASYSGQAVAYECNLPFASVTPADTVQTTGNSGTLTTSENGIIAGICMYRQQTGDSNNLSPMGNQVVTSPIWNEPYIRNGCSVTTSGGDITASCTGPSAGTAISLHGLVAASWTEDNF